MPFPNVTETEAIILLSASLIIFTLCIIIAIVYLYEYLCGDHKDDMQKLKAYFKWSTITTIILSTCCAGFVTAYYIWIIIDPLAVDLLYFFHESHTLRIVITVFWYASKMFPFLIYNGRLRYAFKTGRYGTSKILFTTLNIIILILTPVSLFLGYAGVFIWPNPYLEWIGFNVYRITYIILLLVLSWLFNKRMYVIIIKQTKLSDIELEDIGTNKRKPHKLISHTADDDEDQSSRDNIDNKQQNNHREKSRVSSKTADNDNDLSAQTRPNLMDSPSPNRNSSPNSTETVELEVEASPNPNTKSNSNKKSDADMNTNDDEDQAIVTQSTTTQLSNMDKDEISEIMEYLNVVVKSSLLLTYMIISKIGVMLIWFLHNYNYNSNHLTLCVGFLLMGFDSFVDQLCVVLLYKYSSKYYNILCGCATTETMNENAIEGGKGINRCFTRCCTKIALCYQNKCYHDE